MQYEYTNETTVQVRVSMTYADLTSIKRLIEFKAKTDKLDYRDKDMLAQVKEALHKATESMAAHYEYEIKYSINQEDNNDA